jgi:transcriptional regulator with XRE-family HTH domain
MTPQQMFQIRTGRRLRNSRRAAKLNQTDAARRAEVHRNTLGRWENGIGPISLYEFVCICEACDRRPEDVFAEILSPSGKFDDTWQALRAGEIDISQARTELGIGKEAA